MSHEALVKALHPLEIRALRALKPDTEITTAFLTEMAGLNTGQCNQAVSWLQAKGLIEQSASSSATHYLLTNLGRDYHEQGTPEERLVTALKKGPLGMPALAAETGLAQADLGKAFGQLSREGVLVMGPDKRVTVAGAADASRLATLRRLLSAAAAAADGVDDVTLSDQQRAVMESVSRKRGAGSTMFRVVDTQVTAHRLTAAGVAALGVVEQQGETGNQIGVLTPDLLASGEWQQRGFRRYNLQVAPARVLVGRRSPYAAFLDDLKDRLVSLGFEEMDGPLVETEFWNGDALFMPQFHSARDIHDVYYLKQPTFADEIQQPFLDRVARSHQEGGETGSKGWRYEFDRNFTRRLVLRSHGTVLSAKQLPTAKVPGKYFAVARCFRYDDVDATHLSDFYQTEGIVLGQQVNLRTLLGLLKIFAVEVAGAEDFRFEPAYFPFTEPSVELYIKHPVLGWFELGGAGIFRPEVTNPLGVDVPVLAWGMGIDRMALMSLGLDDLRELFSVDLEQVRLRRRSR